MLLPRLGNIISEIAPNIQLQMVDLVPDSHVETLRSEMIDLALIPRINFPDWVETQVTMSSSFDVVARKGNQRLRDANVAPGEKKSQSKSTATWATFSFRRKASWRV